MQQKLCSRGSASFLLERNATAPGDLLAFRCPRCSGRERFGSLASLRAHLERRHSYRPPDTGGFSITGKLPDPLTAATLWHDMSLPARRGQQSPSRPPHARSLSDSRDGGYLQAYGCSARRRTQSVGVGTQGCEGEEEGEVGGPGEDDEDEEEEEDGEEDDEEEEEGDRCQAEEKNRSMDAGRLNHLNFLFAPPLAHLHPPADLDLLGEFAEHSGICCINCKHADQQL